MLRLLTKRELWLAQDEGFVPSNPIRYHLKYAQDVVAYKLIGREPVGVLGEIGADHSRLLPDFVRHGNSAYAIDVYDRSIGGGKVGPPTDVNYKFFNCLVGINSQDVIPTNHFDVVFSVSVVEHIEDFESLFSDNIRIVKPGGLILHMIDIYLDTEGVVFQPTLARACINFLKRPDVKPLTDEILSFDEMKFRTHLASNGDDMMYQWNKQVPALKEIRERSAVCCLILGAQVAQIAK